MSIIKKRVGTKAEVKRLYIDLGHDLFVNKFKKCDVLLGDIDAIRFIQEKINMPSSK